MELSFLTSIFVFHSTYISFKTHLSSFPNIGQVWTVGDTLTFLHVNHSPNPQRSSLNEPDFSLIFDWKFPASRNHCLNGWCQLSSYHAFEISQFKSGHSELLSTSNIRYTRHCARGDTFLPEECEDGAGGLESMVAKLCHNEPWTEYTTKGIGQHECQSSTCTKYGIISV